MSPRVVIGLAGIVLAGVGVYNLVTVSLSDAVSIVVWLAGGVLLHDFVFAMVVVGLGIWGATLLPRWLAAPVAAGLVVLVTVTATAVPVLGRFGADPTDPWLLDRPYTAGWWAFAGLVAVTTAVGSIVVRRRTHGERPRGR